MSKNKQVGASGQDIKFKGLVEIDYVNAFYVDYRRGNDSWAGTCARPFKTIGHALAVLEPKIKNILVR